MRCVESPDSYTRWEEERLGKKPSLFLAGGITGCPDWQAEMIMRLASTPLVVFNPRRQDFPLNDPSAAEAQIRWEHHYLWRASAILFWFPCETLCPIVLYELGVWMMSSKPLFVGVHPSYQRRQDVMMQTALVRPLLLIVDSLAGLAEMVLTHSFPGCERVA